MSFFDYVLNPSLAIQRDVFPWVQSKINGWLAPDSRTLPPNFGVTPRVDEGAALPFIYGRMRVRTPVMVWSGNFLRPNIRVNATGPNPGATDTADHYSFDAYFIIGIPFYAGVSGADGGGAELLALWAGDTQMTLGEGISLLLGSTQQFSFGPRPPNNTDDISVNGVLYRGNSIQQVAGGASATTEPNASGFDDGVSYGYTASFAGCLAQNGDDFNRTPAYRNQVGAFMHIGLGQSSALPSFSFEVRSMSTGSDSDMGNGELVDDADPSAVIFDLLTATWGKLAIPTSRINLPSFQLASATLLAEGHGYSRVIDQADDARNIIAEILRQIGGTMYEEPTTGLLTVKLIRRDYDPDGLADINPDNMEPPAPGWLSIQGWSDTMNQVRVIYTDRSRDYGKGVAIAQNSANANAQGTKLRSLDVQFPGCCTRELAVILASRELAGISRPLVKATCVVSRQFYGHRPGDVVTLTRPNLGINKMPMRIVSLDFGTLNPGKITIDMVRDIFDTTIGAFPVPPD